ncbi:sulfurtransferase complex subunit TusB [Vibrio intestinalis]|uniref:sulfurtransferase complex subunit TusB n=1 Tax=Vibrio intestinalis TaxID=2933291 RepID=UPI0021A8FB5D|nr:sulfurtransferase complex subunit TusB [Vibrio intestinalis]
MLHIVKTTSAIQDMAKLCQEGDQVLLIEDAIYAANSQHGLFSLLKSLQVYVLENDAIARGIYNRLSPSITAVDYAGFVELTEHHANSLTWN